MAFTHLSSGHHEELRGLLKYLGLGGGDVSFIGEVGWGGKGRFVSLLI